METITIVRGDDYLRQVGITAVDFTYPNIVGTFHPARLSALGARCGRVIG